MPKYLYDEDSLREWATDEEDVDGPVDMEAQIAQYTREPDGQLSSYEPAQCALNPDSLRATARLALQELMNSGVMGMVVRYDGGGDEGFAYLNEAQTALGSLKREGLVTRLQNGPLGESPETSFFYHAPNEKWKVKRAQWTDEALQLFVHELASQLLGDGYGTGEYSLEGVFIADFQQQTLTDIGPEES